VTETTAWGITPEQYTYLRQAINQNRVRELSGNSHLEAWDVRRTLTRVFGFGGWDVETRDLVLVKEIEIPPRSEGGKSRWTVVYRADVRLVIKDAAGREICHFDDSAAGDSQNQPVVGDAHDHAMKTALSQALKRCAVNLGDQFGLSLYDKRRVEGTSVVGGSLVRPASEPTVTVEDATPVTGGELDDNQDVGDAPYEAVPVAPVPPRPPVMTKAERSALLDAIIIGAESVGVSRLDAAKRFADKYGTQIGEGLKADLEAFRDEFRALWVAKRRENAQ
jgi:hypothetical protein